jgi:hypothetical protein
LLVADLVGEEAPETREVALDQAPPGPAVSIAPGLQQGSVVGALAQRG